MQSKNFQCLSFVLKDKNADDLKTLANLCGEISDIHIDNVTVLSTNKAIDVTIKNAPKDLRARIASGLENMGIKADFCLQAPQGRKKSLLICDMDSTLIGQECIDELADFAGVGAHVAGITERAMRGEINFEAALTERVGLLKGLPLSKLQQCFDERISLNAGAKTLCQTMAANGAQTVIVSGGFTFFTSRIAEKAGFAAHQANTLIDDGQALTGAVGMPILGREAKREALEAHSKNLGGAHTALAIGDGANDLAMIQRAGLGIAYRAKPIVASAAHSAIDHADLTAALYFQGYRDADFISD